MSERTSVHQGTRGRIQEVALELFTEQGYEATSLREIAERLGVTKAALYYHFKTKDEIIESLINDQIETINGLIAWARQEPRTKETRCEFIRRYSAMLQEGEHHRLMRFIERNQSSMGQHKGGMQMRERLRQVQELLTDPGAPLASQIRCSLAIFALHSTWLTVPDPAVSDRAKSEA